MNDTECTADFLSALAAFSVSLGQSRLAIYSVEYKMEAFGSWTIELGKRHRRLLVNWDGKESFLSVSQSEVSDSRASKDWKRAADEHIEYQKTANELFRVAENLILENI